MFLFLAAYAASDVSRFATEFRWFFRLKDAGLAGAAVDFLSVDVEGVELMVPLLLLPLLLLLLPPPPPCHCFL